MVLLCCNRSMITLDKLDLTPTFGKKWHKISKLYCTNCGIIKLLETWNSLENDNQYRIYKKDSEKIFQDYKLKPHIKDEKQKQGNQSNMSYAYGHNVNKFIKKTNQVFNYQYRVDFNGTKQLIKVTEFYVE